MKIDNVLFDSTLKGLQKSMDLTWKRNEAVASNISNAETPGYRAVDLTFAGELDRAFGKGSDELKRTNTKHLDLGSEGEAHLVPTFAGPTKNDGNNVDIDIEMGRLEHNRAAYARSADYMRRKLRFLSSAIRAVV